MRLSILICVIWMMISVIKGDVLIRGSSETLKALHNLLSSRSSTARLRAERRDPEEEKRQFADLLEESLSRTKRSVASTVVESARCEHIDLVDCSEYRSQEMSCMLTASGMTCCVCLGRLEYIKGAWKKLRNQAGKPQRRLHVSRTKSLDEERTS